VRRKQWHTTMAAIDNSAAVAGSGIDEGDRLEAKPLAVWPKWARQTS